MYLWLFKTHNGDGLPKNYKHGGRANLRGGINAITMWQDTGICYGNESYTYLNVTAVTSQNV